MIGRGPKRVTSACDTPAQTTTVPAVARNVRPAFSADQCRTCCTYSVRMKKFAKIAAPKSTPTMFAAVTDRFRKISNGISGAFVRVSVTRNAIRNAADRTRRPIVRNVAQPTNGAFEIAYTRIVRLAVTITAPVASNAAGRDLFR